VASSETPKHDALVEQVQSRFSDGVLGVDRSFGDLVVIVDKARAKEVLAFLKDKGFDLLLDIAGVDCLELEDRRERFELEYILYATGADHRVRVRVPVPDGDLDVATCTDLWHSANWGEREAFEMFGFNFVGHPNLKRLLTHHEFKGHPLRKDYPVMQGQWCTTTSDLTSDLEE
jgi:NADH:ubiquinone oxidoreductase subunit C